MAKLQSSKKRIRSNLKRQQRNVSVKSATRTVVKKVSLAIDEGDFETAQTLLSGAVSALDSAVAKGIIKKNTASRRKSQLMKKLNAAQTAA